MLDIFNNITDPGPWHPDGVQHVYIYRASAEVLPRTLMYMYKNKICTTE